MKKTIDEILLNDRFVKLIVSNHVPLRMIIRGEDKLNKELKTYANNVKTHVDFLIYNSLGKTPVLVIEVDGTSYHEEGSIQAGRDKVKDRILSKYEIPYLRLRTDGSNEREKKLTH